MFQFTFVFVEDRKPKSVYLAFHICLHLKDNTKSHEKPQIHLHILLH